MNKKIIVLVVFILVICLVGGGMYLFMNKDTKRNPHKEVELDFEEDKLILIQGGTFTMGSPLSEQQRNDDEVEHQVMINDFYVDPYEVTQESYEEIMGNNPSYFKGDNNPVENVSWYDAIEYCNKLSEKRGLTPVYEINDKEVTWNRNASGYRLLSEAEWEYVARASSKSAFNVGEYIYSEDANFYARYPYLIEENYTKNKNPHVKTGEYRGTTIAVDELGQNDFGLYNTLGNVSEWVFDYYGEYDKNNSDNPYGALTGSLRVNRGGGYNDYGKHLRSAYRTAANPNTKDKNTGFRIARSKVLTDSKITTKESLNIKMKNNPKVLIAYYSYSGNSKNTANIIKEKIDADVFEITMESPYSGNIYDVTSKALNDYDKPKLASHLDNMEDYDVILLGYPNWWATIPMPIISFLEEYDFKDKIIIPFCSHGSGEFGDSVSDIAKLVQSSRIGIGLEYEYSGGQSLNNRIDDWLVENGSED